MEDNKSGSNSDRDRQMMGSFESYADKDDDDDEKKLPAVFEREDTKHEDKGERDDKQQAKAEKKEAEPPVETMDEDEARHAAEEFIEARNQDLAEDLTQAEDDSPEQAEVISAATYNEILGEKIAAGEPATPETFDAAASEASEILGLEAEPAHEDLSTETEPEEPEDAEDDPTLVTTATTTALPYRPLTPAWPGGYGGGSGGSGTRLGTSPASSSRPSSSGGPPTPPVSPENTAFMRRRRAGDMLLGGIVGYLIGRRRGRINTEKRLLPVQEKLEKEVKELHDDIYDRELQIRRMAAEAVAVKPPEARARMIERLETHREQKKSQTIPERERPSVETKRPDLDREGSAERPPRPEALGKFIMPRAEVAQAKVERRPDVDTMTLEQLLAIAVHIERDGINAKQMFEAHRLDSIGLRRLVKEFLGGGRIDQVLVDNLRPLDATERFEVIRDNQALADANITGGGANQDSRAYEQQNPARDYATIPGYHQHGQQQDWLPSPQRRQSHAVVISVAATVGVILAVLLILALR